MFIQQVAIGCGHCHHDTGLHQTRMSRRVYPQLCTTDGRGVPVCSDCDDCFHGR